MKALVTGGSAGLGQAFVARLLADGCDVVSLDRSTADGAANLFQINCDLGDREALDRTVPAIVTAGPYDLVIFNAGVNATGRFEDIPEDVQLRLLRINTEAPMVLAAALAGSGAMVRPSKMVFVSSLSHFTGYPGAAVYAASKDAIAIYARSIRRPLLRLGISVSCVFPGPLRTDHARRHAPENADASQRMPADDAARDILSAVRAGKATVILGKQARIVALAGRIAPRLVTWQMRRFIFEKLSATTW